MSGVWQPGGRAADVERSGQDHEEELRSDEFKASIWGPSSHQGPPLMTYLFSVLMRGSGDVFSGFSQLGAAGDDGPVVGKLM
jgi:hypothetical protein